LNLATGIKVTKEENYGRKTRVAVVPMIRKSVNNTMWRLWKKSVVDLSRHYSEFFFEEPEENYVKFERW